ncbi:MAG: class I SAM-dependent methyltransferase [Anaerolineae bacterium]
MLEIYKVRNGISLQREYDFIYEKQPIRHSLSFYRWILELLSPRQGLRLLDVACGQGVLVHIAREEYGLEAYGLDISFQAVRASDHRNLNLIVGNGQRIPFPENSFHYITCIGSLEHYISLEEGLQEIARVLSPHGLCCLLLPNIFSLFGNILFAWHTGRIADDGQPIQRYATRLKWQEIIEANGLVVLKTYKYECECPRYVKDLIRYLQHPKRLLRLMLTPLLPLNLSNSFVYICRRQEG